MQVVGFARLEDRHFFLEPGGASLALQLLSKRKVDIAQMGYICERIVQLLFRERSAAPVGKARGLVDMDILDTADELVVGNGIAETADHRRDLRVEDRMRNEIAAMENDFDILAGSMKHLQHRWIGHQFEEGCQVQPLGQRVHQHFGGGACHLYQTQFRPEGRFSQEFGIDRNKIRLGQLLAGRLQLGGSFDHLNTFNR